MVCIVPINDTIKKIENNDNINRTSKYRNDKDLERCRKKCNLYCYIIILFSLCLHLIILIIIIIIHYNDYEYINKISTYYKEESNSYSD